MEGLAAAIEALIAESGGLGYALAYAYTIAVAIIPFPADQHLSRAEQDYVIETVRDYYGTG